MDVLKHLFTPMNVYQVISNFGIFALAAVMILNFKKISIGKEGLAIEKDDKGKTITLKTILEEIKTVRSRLGTIEKNSVLQGCDILRINFYLINQPDETKLISGLRYLAAGGNGKTEKDVRDFIDDHHELYRTITALEPSLILK